MNSLKYNKNRIFGVDALKGICILIVIICHTAGFSNVPSDIIASWMKAVFIYGFYFAVGWIYAVKCDEKQSDLCTDIKKRTKSIARPYIVFGILAMLFDAIVGVVLDCPEVVSEYTGINIIKWDIIQLILLLGIRALWFLPVLLIGFIIFAFLTKIKYRNNVMKWGTISVVFLIMIYLYAVVNNRYLNLNEFMPTLVREEYLFIGRLLGAVIYMLIGYSMEYVIDKNRLTKRIGLIVGILCMIFGYKFSICENTIYFFAYNIGTALILIIVCEYKSIYTLLKPIIYCGRYSLEIMILHHIFVLPLIKIAVFKIKGYDTISTNIGAWLLFLVVLMITLGMVYIGNKSEICKFAFGKKNQYKEV